MACRCKWPRFLGPNVYSEAPDGGWGWVVAASFFLVVAFTWGTLKSFGIFLQDLMDEFGESNNRVSWIVSICVFVTTFMGPLSSMMTNRFGFQLVVMIGAVLVSCGTIATSFANSITQMYITYGVVVGLGYCLTFLPTVTILSQYFSRRRSLVTAGASIGEPLALFGLPPALSVLKEHIGWRHTMAVMGALQSVMVICAILLRPVIIKPKATHVTETEGLSLKELEARGTQENSEDSLKSNAFHSLDNELTTSSVSTGDSGVQSLKDTNNSSPEEKTLLDKDTEFKTEQTVSEEKRDKDAETHVMKNEEIKSARNFKLLDFSVLKECSFILYSMFGLFATLGFFAPQLYIIELSVSRGVQRDHATFMLSIMALAEIVGRLSIGWILTRRQFVKNKLLVLLACVLIMTADLVGFTLATEFYGLAVCCSFYGFVMGALSCTHIPILAEDDVVGIERMSSAVGVYVFIHSFAGLGGPPLGGVLVDLTQNYGAAFYSCAAGMAVSAVFLGLVKPAKKGLICKRKNSKHPEDTHERRGDSEEQSADTPDKRTDSSELHEQGEATRDVKEVISFA